MKHLWRALDTAAQDRLTCQACQDRLPEYLLARALGGPGQARWRDVELHLATCPFCSSAYDELAEPAAAWPTRIKGAQ